MRASLRSAFALAFVFGAAAGIVASYVSPAEASRNSSGTYSLPAGNPVVAGTTISATTHNSTNSDIATELTDSLSRSGKGAMLAPLQGYDGTVSAPGYTWGSDADTGLYRIGANNPAMSAGNTKVQEWSTTGSTFPLACTVTGTLSANGGISAAKTSANVITGTATTSGIGVVGVGAGASVGVSGTGGGTDGSGVLGTGGATNGKGVVGQGTGSGAGVQGIGGTTGVGGTFANGTAATGGTRQNAVTLTNGDLSMSGVTNPTSTTGGTNILTPKGLVKSWGYFKTAAGVCTIQDGLNVASCSVGSALVTVTFTTAMANANYALIPGGSSNTTPTHATYTDDNFSRGTGGFALVSRNAATGAALNCSTNNCEGSFVVFGAQ